MSTPTPRHGPGQVSPDIGHPARRNQGFGLAVALAAAILGGLAIQGSYAAAALDRDDEPTAAVVSSAAPTTSAATTADDGDAACEAELRREFAAGNASPDLPACAAVGKERATEILDRISPELIASAASEPDDTAASSAGQPLAAPKGVTVSGDYADTIRVRSFKAQRDALDMFAVVLRVQNTGDAAEFVGVKVTALRGEEVIATADGLIESIDAGQTITTEPFSADDFPKSAKGITYEVELGG